MVNRNNEPIFGETTSPARVKVYELAYLGNNINLVHLSVLVGMTILERLGLKMGIGLADHGLNLGREPSRAVPTKSFHTA